MRTFNSSLDKIAKNVPYFIVALAVVVTIVDLVVYYKSGHDVILLFSISLTPIILCVVVIATYYLQPISITINNDSLTVDRRKNSVTINFSDIRLVRIVREGEMDFPIRTFGNGGLWGYTGSYYNKRLGRMTWYCSQRQKYILVEKNNNKKIIITPDDPIGFMKELKATKPTLTVA